MYQYGVNSNVLEVTKMNIRLESEKNKLLYTIRDIAGMLGVSENAIRQHLFRKTGFLPEPIRLATRKIVWTGEQLMDHFRSITPPPSPPPASSEKKLGRPTKRQALAKAQKEAGG